MGELLSYIWGAVIGAVVVGWTFNALVPVPKGWSSAAIGGTFGMVVNLGMLIGLSVVWLVRFHCRKMAEIDSKRGSLR